MTFKAIVIGVSAGGLKALSTLLSSLPDFFPTPILIVQHMAASDDSFIAEHLDGLSKITVKEAEPRECIVEQHAYIAPGGYHLLVEEDYTLSLDSDERVHYARPSVDVLFECASNVYGQQLIGLILTGANEDGAAGLAKIKERGGVTIVQDPTTAQAPEMPRAAIMKSNVDYVVCLEDMSELLCKLTNHLK